MAEMSATVEQPNDVESLQRLIFELQKQLSRQEKQLAIRDSMIQVMQDEIDLL